MQNRWSIGHRRVVEREEALFEKGLGVLPRRLPEVSEEKERAGMGPGRRIGGRLMILDPPVSNCGVRRADF